MLLKKYLIEESIGSGFLPADYKFGKIHPLRRSLTARAISAWLFLKLRKTVKSHIFQFRSHVET